MRKFTKVIYVLMAVLLSSGMLMAQVDKSVQLGVENKTPSASEIIECPTSAHYLQPPTNFANAHTSAEGPGYLVYSNFTGVANPIEQVRFFGLRLFFTGAFVECDTDPMPFQINFYDDNAGQPGTLQYSFDVYAYTQDIGEPFGTLTSLWQFDSNLPAAVNMANGWMSIQSLATAGDCWFLWCNAPDYPSAVGYQWDGTTLNLLAAPLGFCFSGSPGAQDDVGVIAFNSPVTGPNGSAEPVDVTIYNFGTTSVSNIPVTYIYDGGTPVTETFAGPLAPQTWSNFTFGATVDASVIGPHTLDACTGLSTDIDPSNDCYNGDFSTAPLFECTWTVELYDDFGDGWNGNSLDVLVDGVVVLDDITLASGPGPATFSFGVNNGSVVSTVYNSTGGWPYENYYYIYDEAGVEVGSDGLGGVDPVGISGISGYCNCCDHVVEMFDDFGDGWNNGFIDIYINGTLAYPGVTLASGAGPEYFYFSACTGDLIETVWTAGGWPYEVSYYIYDGVGQLLGSDGVGGIDPVGLTGLTGNCIPLACPDPSDLTATPAATSALLAWTENGTATVWDIEFGTAGFTPTGTPNYPGVTNPYNMTGLSPSTAYDYYVRSDCGGTYSNWVGPYTFTTSCAPVAIPHTENFDQGGAIPACWSTDNPNVWYMNDIWPGNCPPTGYQWYSQYYPYETGTVYSPTFDGSTSTGLYVGFYHYWRANYSSGNQDGYFYGSPDGGATVYLIDEWHHLAPDIEEGWQQYDISSWADGATDIVFWWEVTHDDDWYWVFDDFFIQSGPMTPAGAWTGAYDDDWHVPCNWMDYLVPDMNTDVVVQTGLPNYPTLYAAGDCNNIWLLSDGTNTATLVEQAPLTVHGTAYVDRYYNNFNNWSLISSPIADGQAGIYMDMYLQLYDEPGAFWFDIIPPTDPLIPAMGYALWVPFQMTTSYAGTLNTGVIDIPVSANNPYGWNLLGNPYPASLDWELVYPANPDINGAVYYLDASTGNFVSYNGGMGGGGQYVPPGQGFFVSALGGLFTVDNTMTTHAGNDMYYKEGLSNTVTLQAAGNGYEDATYLRFDESATEEFDGQFDAYKLLSWFNQDIPQLYTTAGGDMLSINVLPATETVPVGFTAGVSGTYEISAPEVNDFGYLVLEDLFTGIETNLLSGSYSFNYDVDDDQNRFLLHFAPLAVPELDANAVNIYAYNKDVYVYVPQNTKGDIVIYNALGQQVVSQPINSSMHKITLENSAYYIVKVLSNEKVVTQKVYID